MEKPVIERTILAFRRDEDGDWVAELVCGHSQHVRHQPPWINRSWAITAAGRRTMLGQRMRCGWCEQAGAAGQAEDEASC